MIKVTNLMKSFGVTTAVDGISFEVGKGEIVGFLGPNGAGKTTTMRMLTGFLSADKGTVEVDGVNVELGSKVVQKQVGYLPENNPLYKEMLVSEFLAMSGELKGLSKSEYKKGLDMVMKAMGLSEVYNRPIKELSKGFKQRVGMAAALIHNPKVVIMDEPTEGLDPNQRTEIRELITKLAKERTFILSTHVMGEAQAVANRLLIISKGKIVADAKPDELDKSEIRKVEVEIEGTNAKKQLAGIKGVTGVLDNGGRSKRKVYVLRVKSGAQIQPEISRLAAKNKWVIWSLKEEKRGLEEVFAELTK